MDCCPPGSSVHGTLQARILEWVAMPSSKGSSQHRDRARASLVSLALAGRFFTLGGKELGDPFEVLSVSNCRCSYPYTGLGYIIFRAHCKMKILGLMLKYDEEISDVNSIALNKSGAV